MDDKILSFEPGCDEIKRDSAPSLFILLASLSFSIVVPFKGPSTFAKSKIEVWIS